MRTQDLSGGPEDDAADWWAGGRTRGGRLHIDDCEMLIDVVDEPTPTEWIAERDSDSGAAQLTGHQEYFTRNFGDKLRAQLKTPQAGAACALCSRTRRR